MQGPHRLGSPAPRSQNEISSGFFAYPPYGDISAMRGGWCINSPGDLDSRCTERDAVNMVTPDSPW